MARVKMVTRTVVGTEVELMVFNYSSNEVDTIKTTIGGQFSDEAKLLKALEKAVNSSEVKVLKVVTATPSNKCYGMSEVDFLKYAKELDTKTRKLLESNPEAEVETSEESDEEATADNTSGTTADSTDNKKKGRK